MHFLLFYDYVANIAERRTPHRPGHLALIKEYVDRGEIVLGGAFADPLDGAAIVFNVADRAKVDDFVKRDPYVVNGLVTKSRIREWSVLVGTAAPPKR